LWFVRLFGQKSPTSPASNTLAEMAGRPCYHQTFVLTTDDKLPTLRKIKRAVSLDTNQPFCSTFNFAQPHPKPTHHPTV